MLLFILVLAIILCSALFGAAWREHTLARTFASAGALRVREAAWLARQEAQEEFRQALLRVTLASGYPETSINQTVCESVCQRIAREIQS